MSRNVFFKMLIVLAVVAGGFIFLAGGALAAGEYDPDAELKDLFYRVLNFSVLLAILVVVFRKARLKDIFTARREGIRERLETFRKQKEAAEKRCNELEAALAAFQSERAGIIEKFRAEGEAEKERIIAEAREKAGQILLEADIAIKREIKKVESRLRAELVDTVTVKAGELIAGVMTDKDQEFLVDEFIKRVEKLN